MESDQLREQFNEWAKVERDNHARAFPNYKFSPSKTHLRRRRDEDEEDDQYNLDDPDGEYVPAGRAVKQPRSQPQQHLVRSGSPYMTDPYVYTTDNLPYAQTWQAGNGRRPLPSSQGVYEPYATQYYHAPLQYGPYGPYGHQMEDKRLKSNTTPVSMYTASPPMGFPGHYQIDYQQIRAATPVQYYQVQDPRTRMGFDGVNYSGHAVDHGYGEGSHFDDAYSSYPNPPEVNMPNPAWPTIPLDPSLMGPSENETMYGQLLNGADHYAAHG